MATPTGKERDDGDDDGKKGWLKRDWFANQNRRAQFRSVVAMVAMPFSASERTGGEESEVEYFDGILDGNILEEADPMRIEGFPMESLFFVDEYDLLLGTIQLLPPKEKIKYAPSSSRVGHIFGGGPA